MEDYKELDYQSKQRNSHIDEMSWSDKFIVNNINFFKVMLGVCAIALILEILA
jgi:hypothetical protein